MKPLTFPAQCDRCGATVNTEAEAFLHAAVHAEPFGTIHGLGKLPFVLFPRIAKLLEEYKRSI